MPKPSLTLKQLKSLIALEDAGHFRRAAERLGVTQPSLTAQIQNLEAALGARLVERGRAGATMTPIGREAARRARLILADVQALQDKTAVAGPGLTGTIRLGAETTLGPYLLPRVVAALHRANPDLRLYVRESPSDALGRELGEGVHDLALTELPLRGADLVVERLFREPIYFAIAADHVLAKAEHVHPSDLQGLELVSLEPRHPLSARVSQLAEEFGTTLLRDYEGTSLDAVRQMIGMGMGATFLPALYVHSEIPEDREVAVRRLAGHQLFRSIGLGWRRSAGLTEAYRGIADTICAVVRDNFDDLVIER